MLIERFENSADLNNDSVIEKKKTFISYKKTILFDTNLIILFSQPSWVMKKTLEKRDEIPRSSNLIEK